MRRCRFLLLLPPSWIRWFTAAAASWCGRCNLQDLFLTPPSGGATLRSQWKWPTDAGDATHRRQQQPLSTIIDSDVAWRGPPLGGGRKEGAASLLLISSLNGPPHQNHKESQRIRRESFKNDPNSWKILQNPQILGKYQRFLYKKWKERWRILQESLEQSKNPSRIVKNPSIIPRNRKILHKSRKNPSKILNNLKNLKESYKKMKESQKNPSKILKIS